MYGLEHPSSSSVCHLCMLGGVTPNPAVVRFRLPNLAVQRGLSHLRKHNRTRYTNLPKSPQISTVRLL